MENTPNNNPTPVPVPTPAPAVPTSDAVPTTPAPAMPVNITPDVVKPVTTDKSAKVKKYIIAGVAGLALLTSIYVGYTFFKPSSDSVDTATKLSDLNNKLSAPSTETTDSKPEETQADKEKLNEVVNELKDQYKTPEVATGNPPGINIQLEGEAATTTPSTENPSQPDSTSDTDTSMPETTSPSTENPPQPDAPASTSTDTSSAAPETSDSASIPR